jgi:alcohol dehydrogenase (cytochrome c)
MLAAMSALQAQGLDPRLLGQPPTQAWPTYHGDYSGRRYSTLKQISRANVKDLSLGWVHRLQLGTQGANIGGEGANGPPVDAVESRFGRGLAKATPLMVNGVIYYSAPDNVWAIDARSGEAIWHYFWKTTGGIHIGNRGVGMYGNWLYFETPDDFIVSLDAATGQERWHKKIADVKHDYFATSAPIVIGHHVIVGLGGDSGNEPGWLEARDPDSGEIQWKWFTTPRPGQPGAETWPNAAAMEHGGGMPWAPQTYDPELKLLYVPTGNPSPVQIGDARMGDNLWTESIVALDIETGKLVWYFQCSPHDTHDWDASEVPVLFDAIIDGKPRKLVAQASRNGLFFVLDRITGKALVSTPFVASANWYLGFDKRGEPIPNPAKEPQIGGVLVSPSNGGAANWLPPTYSPDTGLFYVNASETYSLYYRTQKDPNVVGSGGFVENGLGGFSNSLRAINARTGKIRWSHTYAGVRDAAARPERNGGLMSTAGRLVFGGGLSSQVVAYDDTSGKILWHSGLHAPMNNAPITYLLDGVQYVVVGADDSLYAFRLQ